MAKKRLIKKMRLGPGIAGLYGLGQGQPLRLPLYLAKVPAGFPSPADDFLDRRLDLNEFLIKHPAATFFVKVQGESMIRAGIHSGDILIVDRALEAADRRIVVAAVDGELVVKRLRRRREKVYLASENPDYKEMEVTPEMGFEVWGVVTYVIHAL
jgi:DNA polymerase V